jgi:hypothetical protein
MVQELNLKPGWLHLDMEKAAERVREWSGDQPATVDRSANQNTPSDTAPARSVQAG